MSNLRYLCLLRHSSVQHILCCVFVLFVIVLCLVYLVLSVSLDGSFAIASSIFSNVYSLNTLFILFSISKKIILGVIFPTNQSVTFLPNAEVLKSNKKKRSRCFVDLSVDMLFPN
jgi:hypothetical protein